jgi:hypothetical protein
MEMSGIPDLMQVGILRTALQNSLNQGTDTHGTWAQLLSPAFLLHLNIFLACILAGNFGATKRFFHFINKILKKNLIVWTVKICILN